MSVPTYVSVLNWYGSPQPTPAAVRDAIQERAAFLRRKGLHSVVFLPDEGRCAAIVIATARDAAAVSSLVRSIFPSAAMDCDTMLFDAQPAPTPRPRTIHPPSSGDFRQALLRDLVATG